MICLSQGLEDDVLVVMCCEELVDWSGVAAAVTIVEAAEDTAALLCLLPAP